MDQLQQQWDRFTQWWVDLHFTTTQRRTLGAIAGVLIALSLFVVFSGKSEEVVAEPITPTQMVAPALIIDVTGEVVSPGVYELPAGSRVIDAIKAAGGARPKAALSDLNLARVIKDGEQVYVYPPSRNGGSARSSVRNAPTRSSGPIVLNRASAKELEALGIPIELSVREVKDLLRERGIVPGNNTTLNNAIACRKQPSPDPLGNTITKKEV